MSRKRRTTPATIQGSQGRTLLQSRLGRANRFFPPLECVTGRLKFPEGPPPPPPANSPVSRQMRANRNQRRNRKGTKSWRFVWLNAGPMQSTADNGLDILQPPWESRSHISNAIHGLVAEEDNVSAKGSQAARRRCVTGRVGSHYTVLLGDRAEGCKDMPGGRRSRQPVAIQPVSPNHEQPQTQAPDGHGFFAGGRRTEEVDEVDQQ